MQQENTGSGSSTFSTWQLTVLVIMAGMGGMYFYPTGFGRESLALLAGAVVLSLVSLAMLAYCFRHSGSVSFPNLLQEHLGRWPAKIILAAGAVLFGAEVCCIVVKQTQMTGLFLLEKTPPQVVLAVTLLTVCFIITSGIRQIARTAELLFLAVLLPLALILAMAVYSAHFGELLPLMKPHAFTLPQVRMAVLPLSGIAATGYFAGYYDKKKLAGGLLTGGAVLGACCVVILLCCVGVFSVKGVAHLSFPLTELSRIVSVGNITLNHRFDILYIMVYTAVSVIAAGILLYCCGISLCGVFEVKSHSCFIFLLLPVVFVFAYAGLSDLVWAERLAAWGKLFFLFALVPVLFVITAYKTWRGKQA